MTRQPHVPEALGDLLEVLEKASSTASPAGPCMVCMPRSMREAPEALEKKSFPHGGRWEDYLIEALPGPFPFAIPLEEAAGLGIEDGVRFVTQCSGSRCVVVKCISWNPNKQGSQ
jgi:hypothetical protein